MLLILSLSTCYPRMPISFILLGDQRQIVPLFLCLIIKYSSFLRVLIKSYVTSMKDVNISYIWQIIIDYWLCVRCFAGQYDTGRWIRHGPCPLQHRKTKWKCYSNGRTIRARLSSLLYFKLHECKRRKVVHLIIFYSWIYSLNITMDQNFSSALEQQGILVQEVNNILLRLEINGRKHITKNNCE